MRSWLPSPGGPGGRLGEGLGVRDSRRHSPTTPAASHGVQAVTLVSGKSAQAMTPPPSA